MKIITIGGATQDIFLHYAGADAMTINKHGLTQSYMLFESGEKVEIESLQYHTGGGATNAATSFSRLGLKTACYSRIGNDQAGDAVTTDLTQEHVETNLIVADPGLATGVSTIINSIHGERTVFTYRGANTMLTTNPALLDALGKASQLYITSLSQQASAMLPALVAYAKSHQVPVAINPGSSQLAHDTYNLKKSLAAIDTLILNSSEARTFMTALAQTDETYKDSLSSKNELNPCELNAADATPYLINHPLNCQNLYFSMPKFFAEVLKMGPSIVIVTNGANGVYIATYEKIFFHPSIKTTVVSSVGAGDAFGSCFIASLMLGYSIPDALRNGVVNSASVLEHVGAKTGLLTHNQLQERVKKVSTTLLQTLSR